MKRALALAATVLLAGCGGAAAAHPAAVSPNARACQHFRVQGQKYAALAAPTLMDAAQAVAWVKEDASLATDPALRRDFRHWVADANQMAKGRKPTDNPKAAIVAACARYGVKA